MELSRKASHQCHGFGVSHTSRTTTSNRIHRTKGSSSAALSSPPSSSSSCPSVSPAPLTVVGGASKQEGTALQATKGDETWSRTSRSGGNGPRKESRLGVRRRVRKVLEKARQRTGVPNDSNTGANTGSVIAETAALGLFDDSVMDLDFDLIGNGSADVTSSSSRITSQFPKNDTEPSLVLGETYPVSNGVSKPAASNGVVAPNGASSSSSSSSSSTNSGAVNGATSPVMVPKNNGQTVVSSTRLPTTSSKSVAVDAVLQADPVELEPLPFSLPKLSEDQVALIEQGERIQEQSKMGREGSGYVVWDIPAPAYAIWECLLDFESYPENIGTVRSMRMFTNTHLKQSYISEKPVPPGTGMETRHYGTASISRAAFVLSKFRLNIAAIHRYQPHPDGHYMVFTLDKACKNVVLQDAKGIWYTEDNVRPGYTRVWLLCELKVSPVLPTFIVDYTAKRAMPRATTWLAPVVEKFIQRWNGNK